LLLSDGPPLTNFGPFFLGCSPSEVSKKLWKSAESEVLPQPQGIATVVSNDVVVLAAAAGATVRRGGARGSVLIHKHRPG